MSQNSKNGDWGIGGLLGMELESRKLLGTEVAFSGGVSIPFHDTAASPHSSPESFLSAWPWVVPSDRF